MSSLSENIHAIRMQTNLTEAMIAEKLSVSAAEVSGWESGETEPDGEMLERLAIVLETDVKTLLSAAGSGENRKKEIRRFIISAGILLIIGAAVYILSPIVRNAKKDLMMTEPDWLMQMFLLPLFWLVLGWTLMQCSGTLGLIKRADTKAGRIIHIAMLTLVLLYAVLILPFLIEIVRMLILDIEFQKNPSHFPNGLSQYSNLPKLLDDLGYTLLSSVYGRSALFFVPAVLFWVSGAKHCE